MRRSSHWIRFSTAMLVVAYCILSGGVAPPLASADPRLSVRLEPAANQVSAGDNLTYDAFLQCSIPGDCQNVQVRFTPPPGMSGPGEIVRPLPPGVTNVVVEPDGTVVVTYDHVGVGESSQVSVTWPTANYYTKPGEQPVTMTATTDNGDGTPSTDNASIDVVAKPKPTIRKDGPARATLGSDVTYRVFAQHDGSSTGMLALENARMVDTLPPGVEFVSATPPGVTYDPATRTLTWPIDTNPDRPGNQFDGSQQLQYSITVKVTDPALVGTSIVNHARIDGTPFGGGDDRTWATDDASTEIITGGGESGFQGSKRARDTGVAHGQLTYFDIYAQNTGHTTADVVITDPMPAGLDATEASLGDQATGQPLTGAATVLVSYADGSTRTVNWPADSSGGRVDVTKAGTRVTKLVVTVPGTVPSGGVTMTVTGRANINELGDLTTDDKGNKIGRFTNCATIEATFPTGPPYTENSCATVQVSERSSAPSLDKSTNGAPVGPGNALTWTVGFTNDSAYTDASPLTPKFYDLLPPELTYVAGSWKLAAGQPDFCPTGDKYAVRVEPNYLDGRAALVAVAADGATIPARNSRCAYTFETTVNPGTASGTYGGDPANPLTYKGNVAYLYDKSATTYPDSYGKRTPDGRDVDKNGNTTEGVASATGNFAVASSSALSVSKEVKGDSDADFLPSAETPGNADKVGRSTVSGTVDYRVKLGNLGNTPLTKLVAYDLLPSPEAPGVTDGRYGDNSKNPSVWRPTLTGPIGTGGAPVTITYSTKVDPCRPEMDNTAAHTAPFYCGGVVDPTFLPAAQVTDWSAIRAVRFDFGAHVFTGGQTFAFTWSMKVPDRLPGGAAFVGGERTWNRIAVQGDRVNQSTGDTTPLLATEAPWVVDSVLPPPVPPTTTPPTPPPTTTPPTTVPPTTVPPVTGTTEPPAVTTAVTTEPPPGEPDYEQPPGEDLAWTGVSVVGLLCLAVALLIGGFVLVRRFRRRV
ncbi:hypothetical protein F0L68_24010 [Solihabitans fulvus]|uniref:DUF11 domain-containing protein n=1 Tax=Solihabitans fulvus TaxID=1892852 RepID=A0A5B2X4K6_9PSEU|nr:DUF11 domain-containing protein [Solihabitans fulvus]KAA2258051.1 hypothetical protein F0L68_24010 [Solihabitans fulvus]